MVSLRPEEVMSVELGQPAECLDQCHQVLVIGKEVPVDHCPSWDQQKIWLEG